MYAFQLERSAVVLEAKELAEVARDLPEAMAQKEKEEGQEKAKEQAVRGKAKAEEKNTCIIIRAIQHEKHGGMRVVHQQMQSNNQFRVTKVPCAMKDLKSKKWIVAKGVMFLVIATLAATLIMVETPSLKLAALLVLLVWASCRFYYFLFYVLEHYVDPTMRYAGIFDLMLGMRRRRQERRHNLFQGTETKQDPSQPA